MFNTEVTDLIIEKDKVKGVKIKKTASNEEEKEMLHLHPCVYSSSG